MFYLTSVYTNAGVLCNVMFVLLLLLFVRRKLHTDFHTGPINLLSHGQCIWVPFPLFYIHLYILLYLFNRNFYYFDGNKWSSGIQLQLAYIFLKTRNAGHVLFLMLDNKTCKYINDLSLPKME